MSIDVHNHFYPQSYLQLLESGKYRAKLDHSAGSDPVLHYAGDYNILVPGHRDLSARLEDMQRAAMQSQALTLTTPGVHIEEAQAGAELARAVNEDFSAICRENGESFYAFAALPLQEPSAAVDELRHAVTELGLHGALLFTNINGRPLDDPAFAPIFAAAEELRAPLLVHPTSPDDYSMLDDYRLVPLLGFLFDTTTTVSRLVLSGTFERHPDLVLIAAHLGGTLPYVAERLDRGYAVYPEISDLIPRPPSEYLGRLYYDTVAFDPDALEFARTSMGTDRLLLGSDYPHQIGDMRRALDVIDEMKLPGEDRESIMRGNFLRLVNAIDR